MTPTTPEPETAVLELGLQLPADVRERVALRLLDSLEPPGHDPDAHRRAWREEIGRRLDAVRRGEMKTYTLEETMEYLRTVVDEGQSP